jgi:LPS O-antigen subunit length determinant protein (WzzB/FepE family)
MAFKLLEKLKPDIEIKKKALQQKIKKLESKKQNLLDLRLE